MRLIEDLSSLIIPNLIFTPKTYLCKAFGRESRKPDFQDLSKSEGTLYWKCGKVYNINCSDGALCTALSSSVKMGNQGHVRL